MTTPNDDPTQFTPLTKEEAAALAARLAEEMIERWREDDRVLTEDFLVRHPELRQRPEAAADLIYEELCLRQEHGSETPLEAVLGRFPEWRPQLQVLIDCQRLLGPRAVVPKFPAPGEFLGDFLLLLELGRGAQGRVFLANQLSLGDRLVVLKITPCETAEHLSLARLQHTHIVPIYCVQDHAARGLRALCMPYFGGATLGQVLDATQSIPPPKRSGKDLLDALDRLQAMPSLENQPRGPARQALGDATYVQAVCWIAACLADALQYAHERGLVHLDLKPSNVLLAADGQPMLLDFHLARPPILPDSLEPAWLGGTNGYMSPEQQSALLNTTLGRKVVHAVDARSDIYSLGVVLYQTLGGRLPPSPAPPPPLSSENPLVSVGLADVVRKCLALDPADRYADMAALAADLRRHLAHRPLVGVRNRSVLERWRKWRRRKPHGVALAGMMLTVLTAASAVALGAVSHFTRLNDQVHSALEDGKAQMVKGDWQGAIGTMERGRTIARGLPFHAHLADDLDRRLDIAEKARTAADCEATTAALHRLIDRLRYLHEAENNPSDALRGLETSCRDLWNQRQRIVNRVVPMGTTAINPVVQNDLTDLAILWAELHVRLAPATEKETARQLALAILASAEELFGPNPVLNAERKHYGLAAGHAISRPSDAPDTAWAHYALGRALLRAGDLAQADKEMRQALVLEPHGLWPNFYMGLCAYRLGRHADAALAYSVCIGRTPEVASCYYNRALALTAQGLRDQALRDYDQALRLDPTLAAAAMNRGMLHYQAKRFGDALTDLQQAQTLGADPAAASFNLALIRLARGERVAALEDLHRTLNLNADQPAARALLDSLIKQDRPSQADIPIPRRSFAPKSAPALSPNSR